MRSIYSKVFSDLFSRYSAMSYSTYATKILTENRFGKIEFTLIGCKCD